MNPLTNVKNVNKMNQRELELGVAGTSTSWHAQYKDSAWIFIGGLPYDLSEGDVLCIFSQYGEIVNINMVRDPKTGKPRGFCFICYEDQRSTILAVDNFNGIKVLNRTLRVDHVNDYKPPKEQEDADEITKKLRMEGCAPKLPESEPEEDSELEQEDVPAAPKKHKKEKRKKEKKKKKKKRKRTESLDVDSDSSSSTEASARGREPPNIVVKSEPENRGPVDSNHSNYPRRNTEVRERSNQEGLNSRQKNGIPHEGRRHQREDAHSEMRRNRDGEKDRDREISRDRSSIRNRDGERHQERSRDRDCEQSREREYTRERDRYRHKDKHTSNRADSPEERRERHDRRDKYDDRGRRQGERWRERPRD